MSRSRPYDDAVRTAGECIHGLEGGDIVRPWTGSPACPLCRGRHRVHWRWLPDEPKPLPPNVIPLAGARKLF